MSEKAITAGVTILVAIVGVAALAVLVSRSSQTSGVIGAGAGGFATALCAALSPLGVSCGGGSRALIPDVNSTITFGT
jgi:hypothetical protein